MARSVAYILKAFGRTSETFITNEIYLLEQMGLRLRVFSLKKLDGQKPHARLAAISSRVDYLPETEQLSGCSLTGWLWRNFGRFSRSHRILLKEVPVPYIRTLFQAIAMCIRYRETMWSRPRKVFLKEFLQAGEIAQQVLSDPQVQHLHAHFCHGVTTVALFTSRLTGIPFSFTAHAKDIYLPELNPGNLLPFKMSEARFIVTCTGANKTFLDERRATSAAPVHTIYHGLDTALFAPVQRAQKSRRILSVGRFVEKKGFLTLVDACAILRDRGIPFECLIVGGSDAYQRQVEHRIEQHNLRQHVTLQNAVTQEQLRNIYAESAVFALPCQVLDNGDRDGIPNVLAEAMAMGLPVVSTDVSGIPEIVRSGANGILVQPKDPAALASALEDVLQEQSLRRRLGDAARTTILDVFDSKRNTAELARLFLHELNVDLPGREAENEVAA